MRSLNSNIIDIIGRFKKRATFRNYPIVFSQIKQLLIF